MSHNQGSLHTQPWTQHLKGSCRLSASGPCPTQARPVAQDVGHTRGSLWPVSPASRPTTTACLTVDKDSETQKVQVALTAAGVPANVWVPFGEEHRTALEATASQVGHHLGVEGAQPEARLTLPFSPGLRSLSIPGAPQSDYLWIPWQTITLIIHPQLPPGPL